MANGPVNPKIHKDLLLACGWGKEIDVVLLLQQGASVKVQDQNGRNCLHYAASKGHTNIVEILLLKKCNANAKDKYGSTPLHQAAVNGHTECALTLIEGGGDVNFQDDNGNTPLYEAVWNNQVDTVDLFLNGDADVNIRNKEGYTPLHLACQNNYVKIIKNLVKWGASLQSPTSVGNTPLHIAIQSGQVEATKALLTLEADINLQNHDGDTPLHLCAEHGDKKITKLILESGQAYEASLNNVGDSAKDIAVQLGNKDVAELIPTPMIARKHSKKIESKIPGSPKRAPKQRQSAKPKIVTKSQDKENTDSLERPVRVVVQPPSDNLLATDTCSSLSSLWLPVPDSGAKLPMIPALFLDYHMTCSSENILSWFRKRNSMSTVKKTTSETLILKPGNMHRRDVHWQKTMSPSTERKAKNFDNITDLMALKDMKKIDQHSQSDGSGIRSPRYQIRKKRRKYVTSPTSSRSNKDKDEDIDEILVGNGKESKRIKDPKTAKLFKKKKHSSVKKASTKKLKRVPEQGEEEISLASPTSQEKSDITSGLASPRVKGRKEIKLDLNQSKQSADQNGTLPSEEKIIEDLRTQKKGLKDYLKDSLIARKSPSNTDEGSASKAGTLEHKKGRDSKMGHADLRQHMKLTERDIDALIKKEVLETIKNNSVPSKTVKDKKKSGKSSKKKIYASDDDDDGEEIVVIRLDPSLETPKKAKRTKKSKDRQLENGVHVGETRTKEKKDKHLLDNSFQGRDTIERKHEKRTEKKEIKDEKTDKLKKDLSTGSLKKEKKTDMKDWPKFEVNVDVTCGAEQGPSGPTSPRERTPNGTTERSHRHHRKQKTPEAPSGNPMFDKIHQLEKRFKHFLKLTTEKLDEQKETDNRHYSDLKNDISSMEKQIERSARNSAVEIVESLSKELENTMRKWTKVLNRRSTEGPKDGASSDSDNLDKSVENGVLSARSVSSENSSKPKTLGSDISSSILEHSVDTGAVKMREAIVIGSNSEEKVNGDISKGSSENEAAVKGVGSPECNRKCEASGCGPEQQSPVHQEHRAAPQGRSDESSPCPQSRHPGDGDHMSLEKWYQEQLKEAEERWRLKAEADQEGLRNRVKELEELLFQFTGSHNTMV